MDIAIWGTGNFGKYIWNMLKERKECNIKYFIDSNQKLWGADLDGVPIMSPEQLYEGLIDRLDFILVAYINSAYQGKKIIRGDSAKFGFIRNKVLWAGLTLENDFSKDKNIIQIDVNTPHLFKIETNIVDYCNLNCRACSHFSNIFKTGDKVPYEVFCRDLAQIVKHVSVTQLDLLGGEALLDERITDYIVSSRKLLPDAEIQLVSNGLLIPRQTEDFFRCCVENDIYINISGYFPTMEMRTDIIKVLEAHGVTFLFRNVVEDFGKNISLAGKEDKYIAMKNCREYKCHFFRYGKLYKCPFEALGNKLFSHYDIDVRLNGGIDIYDETMDWNTVVEQIENEPVDACRYCGKEVRVDWACNQSPMLEDWIL